MALYWLWIVAIEDVGGGGWYCGGGFAKCGCGWVCDYYVCWVYDVAGLFQLRERERERKEDRERVEEEQREINK